MDPLAQLRAGKLTGATRLDLSCGLAEFPREIFDLADTLEVLNLSQNRLSELPGDLPRLKKLRILFCSENDFTHLPAVLGECPGLSMIGFKSNRIATIDDAAFPAGLRWLVLTDNRIGRLPSSLGKCLRLQKLMLAGNRLEHLPDEMAACVNLELIRLAANRFQALPGWLFELPRLSWLAFAGNPMSAEHEVEARAIGWAEIEPGEKLGEGASGVIFKAFWQGHGPVAVKIFKGEMTSDGLPESEIAACLAAGGHPGLIGVLGRIADHPEGRAGLVMSLIDGDFENLAGPPSLESCTRDIYRDGERIQLDAALEMAVTLASVAAQLHARGIMHGDFYAHNILRDGKGGCLLGDFGAASFYTSGAFERIEVRAFGCLLEELLDRVIEEPAPELRELQARCLSESVAARPTFAELEREIHSSAGYVSSSTTILGNTGFGFPIA